MITLLTTPGLRLMGAARLEGMQRVGEGWEWKRGGKRGEETGRGGNGNGGRLDCLREEEAQKNLFERSRYRYSHFLKPSLYIYICCYFFLLSFFGYHLIPLLMFGCVYWDLPFIHAGFEFAFIGLMFNSYLVLYPLFLRSRMRYWHLHFDFCFKSHFENCFDPLPRSGHL